MNQSLEIFFDIFSVKQKLSSNYTLQKKFKRFKITM